MALGIENLSSSYVQLDFSPLFTAATSPEQRGDNGGDGDGNGGDAFNGGRRMRRCGNNGGTFVLQKRSCAQPLLPSNVTV